MRRRTEPSGWVAVGAALAFGLAWVAFPSPVAAQLPTPDFPTLPPDAPVGEGVTQPCLESVPGAVVCGRFRVWEDRDAEAGRTLDLAFVVLPALNDTGNTDAVTFLSGGPGAATTGNAAMFARSRAFLRETRDLLLIDHRGTGASGALTCDMPWPGGVESRIGTVFPLDLVEACREELARRADLTQYTSVRAVDDLADLTRWLGYSGLNLRSGSYGTREAAIFARRHPGLTRTVILNGVALVHEPGYVTHARLLHESLENLFAECEATPACREAYPELRRVTAEVLAEADRDPPLVRAGGKEVRFGAGDLSYALRGLLYGRSGSLPARLHEAHQGQWQPLADFYLARQAWVTSPSFPTGYHFSVLCAEDLNRVTWEDIEEETHGTFMGDHLVAGYKRVCQRWPAAELPEEFFEPVRSDAPTLILSGGRDPVTPPASGAVVARLWPNSLHVVVPNGGHGQGGPCIRSMIEQLVETGSVDGIDTSCVEAAPPTRFELPGG